MIERACLPEPPCDCLMETSCPVLAFQYFTKAALKSTYSSRVGSYETFSSCSGCAMDGRPVRPSTPAAAMARGILIKSRRRLMELPCYGSAHSGSRSAEVERQRSRIHIP